MKKLDIKTIGKLKPNPLFKGMPSLLKDPKNYKKIESSLVKILQADHKHKTASAYVKCADCQNKRQERTAKMKQVGFKSIQQYMEWKKIMDIIINKRSFQLK